jgi:citrate lyase beta subunit
MPTSSLRHNLPKTVEKLDTLRHIGEATKTHVVDLPEKTCAGTDGASTYAREAHT